MRPLLVACCLIVFGSTCSAVEIRIDFDPPDPDRIQTGTDDDPDVVRQAAQQPIAGSAANDV